MLYRTRIPVCVCLIACAILAFQSCDDNVTCPTNHTPTPSGAQVTVSPDTVTLQLGEHRSFTALYKGEPAEFLWRVTSGPGEILASGEYIAPSELAVYSMTATIKAVLATDTNQFGYAKVVVLGSNTGGGGNGGGGGQPIDTTVCFERDILPILRSSCAMSGCHDSQTHEEGIDLTSYVSMQNSKKRLVVAHDVQGSKLYKAITEDEGDDDRMPPPPRPRLTDDQIALIRRWILEGATNRDCSQDSTGCDVSNVTYAKTIQPILQNNCLGCHSGSAPTAGISLVGYTNVKKLADDGRLVGVTSHAQGYIAMPPGGTLQNCAIEQIKKWVENGAPNN